MMFFEFQSKVLFLARFVGLPLHRCSLQVAEEGGTGKVSVVSRTNVGRDVSCVVFVLMAGVVLGVCPF